MISKGGIDTVVYVDILVFINTVVDYVILITVEKLLKKQVKLYRLIIASFICSFFSLVIFFKISEIISLLLIRPLCGCVMTLIAFGYHGLKEFVKYACTTVLVTALYAGLFILYYQLVKPPNMIIVNDVPYFEFNPLLMLCVTVVIYFIISLANKLLNKRMSATIVELSFMIDGQRYACIGKIDTGCNLIEPFSKAPVIIVKRSVYDPPSQVQKRIIPYSTINGSSFLYAVKCDQVEIGHKAINIPVYIAVTDNILGEAEAIINSETVR